MQIIAAERKTAHDHVHPESSIVSGKLVIPEHLMNAETVQQIDAALGQDRPMPEIVAGSGDVELVFWL